MKKTERTDPSDTYRRIYAVVSRISKGRVPTYGQVAELALAAPERLTFDGASRAGARRIAVRLRCGVAAGPR